MEMEVEVEIEVEVEVCRLQLKMDVLRGFKSGIFKLCKQIMHLVTHLIHCKKATEKG